MISDQSKKQRDGERWRRRELNRKQCVNTCRTNSVKQTRRDAPSTRLLSSSFLHYSLIASTVAYFSFVEADAVNHGLGCLSTRLDGDRLVSELQLIDSATQALHSVVQTDLNRTRSRRYSITNISTIKDISEYFRSVQDSDRRPIP